jgi:hypothetical protein
VILESLHRELPVREILKIFEPFQGLGIGATSDFGVESRGLPVREILKRSEPFQEFGEWSDQWFGSLHFKLSGY